MKRIYKISARSLTTDFRFSIFDFRFWAFGIWVLAFGFWLFAAPAALAGPGACVNNGAPSFSCPTPPNTDVCGSGGNFLCKVAPNCPVKESNNCADSNCACVCNSGYTRCTAGGYPNTGVCVTNLNCPTGTSFNPCTNTCETPYALLNPPAVQGGSLNITGQYLINGVPITGGGGAVSGSGITNYVARWSAPAVLTTGLLYDDGVNIGIRTPAPGYVLDVRDPGNTTIIRLSQDNAAKKWSGVRLDRSLSEKWFLGMNDTDDSFRVRRSGSSDDLIIDGSGIVQVNAFKLATGAQSNYVLTSDAAGAASWKQLTVACGSTFSAFTATSYNGNLNGNPGGYGELIAGAICNPGSHICTPDEILATRRCGGALPGSGGAWVANGPPGFTSPAANDCSGFTTASPSSYGAFWEFTGTIGAGYATTCDQSLPIACCR